MNIVYTKSSMIKRWLNCHRRIDNKPELTDFDLTYKNHNEVLSGLNYPGVNLYTTTGDFIAWMNIHCFNKWFKLKVTLN